MIFDEDHWESYDEPALALHAGPRLRRHAVPAARGRRARRGVGAFHRGRAELVARFGVRLTIGVHGIPMGVPHTRPTGVTAHGTRPRADRGPRALDRPHPGAGQRRSTCSSCASASSGHDAMGSPCTCRTTSRRPSTRLPPQPCSTRWPRPAAWSCRPPRCARRREQTRAADRRAGRRRQPEVAAVVQRARAAVRRLLSPARARDLLAGRAGGLPDRRRARCRAGALPCRGERAARPRRGLRPACSAAHPASPPRITPSRTAVSAARNDTAPQTASPRRELARSCR